VTFTAAFIIVANTISKFNAKQVFLEKKINNLESKLKMHEDILFGFSNVKFPAVEYEITGLYKIIDILESKINFIKQEMDK
jgi:hypothetical protein